MTEKENLKAQAFLDLTPKKALKTIFNEYYPDEQKILVPYEVIFQYQGQIVKAQLYNEPMSLDDQDHCRGVFLFNDELFYLVVGPDQAEINAYEDRKDEITGEFVWTQVFSTNNFIVNSVEPHRAHFVLLDSMASCRLTGEKRAIAEKIYPDRIELKGTSEDEREAEIKKLTNDLFGLYLQLGGQLEDIRLMPDLWRHVHLMVGQTPVSLDAHLPTEEKAIQFWEGNLEKGYNVTIDFSRMRTHDQQAFVSEVCSELGIVDLEAIEDSELKEALDPTAIGQTYFYVSPNDTLAQAYCREYIREDRFWTENWKEELKKQSELQNTNGKSRVSHR